MRLYLGIIGIPYCEHQKQFLNKLIIYFLSMFLCVCDDYIIRSTKKIYSGVAKCHIYFPGKKKLIFLSLLKFAPGVSEGP